MQGIIWTHKIHIDTKQWKKGFKCFCLKFTKKYKLINNGSLTRHIAFEKSKCYSKLMLVPTNFHGWHRQNERFSFPFEKTCLNNGYGIWLHVSRTLSHVNVPMEIDYLSGDIEVVTGRSEFLLRHGGEPFHVTGPFQPYSSPSLRKLFILWCMATNSREIK